VLKVNKVQSNMMLSLVSYGPSYVSPNVTVGKDEALKFFPEDYKPQEEVIVEPEKKKKRVSFRLKNSLTSYSRIRVLIHFSCRARRVKISESRWKRRPQQQRLLPRLLPRLLLQSKAKLPSQRLQSKERAKFLWLRRKEKQLPPERVSRWPPLNPPLRPQRRKLLPPKHLNQRLPLILLRLSLFLLILLPSSSNHTFKKSTNSFFSYQIVCPIVKIFKCNLLKYIKKFWFC